MRDLVDRVIATLGGGEAAAELVYRTGLAESGYRTREQYDGGPARGFWQMEPATEYDIHDNFLAYRPELAALVDSFGEPNPLTNDEYAAAMCRVHYMRVPDPLPPADDLLGQAAYWKAHYNTPLGKGTMKHFIATVEADTA